MPGLAWLRSILLHGSRTLGMCRVEPGGRVGPTPMFGRLYVEFLSNQLIQCVYSII